MGSSLNDTRYAALEVVAVSAPFVTLQLITIFKNGTGSHQGLTVNVDTGASNITSFGQGASGDYFVLAGGLAKPDHIWNSPSAPTFNATKSETILGSMRMINFLNITSSFNIMGSGFSSSTGFAFDQSTGLFVEISFSFTSTGILGDTTQKFAIGMVDNNIWGTASLPDFGLSASPTTIPIVGSSVGTSMVTLTRSPGFSATVKLSTTQSSSMISCSLSSTSLAIGGSDTSTLTCSGSPGTYVVMIDGNSGYSIRSVSVTVDITPVPDFQISNTGPISFQTGSSGSTTITIMALYGYTDTTDLQVTNVPAGLACSLDKNSISGSGSATLTCSGQPGTYTVTVKGSGGGTSHSTNTTVTVRGAPDFEITRSGPISFQTGGSGTATITITAQNGYSATTNLEITNVPSGLTCSLDRTSISGYGTVTLTCSGQPGSYTVTVKATGGDSSHSTDTPVTVSAAQTPSQPASSIPVAFVYGGIGIAIVVAAIVAYLFLRRKPKAPVAVP